MRLLFLISICFSSIVIAQIKDLDGTSYTIEVTQQSGIKHKPRSGWPIDTLKFDSGKMYSVYMQERERFYSSAYVPKSHKASTDDSFTFNYENNNPGGSFLRIEGIVTGKTIAGNIRWTSSKKQTSRTYTFKGVLNE